MRECTDRTRQRAAITPPQKFYKTIISRKVFGLAILFTLPQMPGFTFFRTFRYCLMAYAVLPRKIIKRTYSQLKIGKQKHASETFFPSFAEEILVHLYLFLKSSQKTVHNILKYIEKLAYVYIFYTTNFFALL